MIEAITRVDAIQKPLRMPQERRSPRGRSCGIALFRPRTASATPRDRTNFALALGARLGTMEITALFI